MSANTLCKGLTLLGYQHTCTVGRGLPSTNRLNLHMCCWRVHTCIHVYCILPAHVLLTYMYMYIHVYITCTCCWCVHTYMYTCILPVYYLHMCCWRTCMNYTLYQSSQNNYVNMYRKPGICQNKYIVMIVNYNYIIIYIHVAHMID